jgi:large exoprotein involved in heme utilization and adhesion
MAAILNILHTWDSDLETTLISPSGASALLFSGVGGPGENFMDTRLDGQAKTRIEDGSAPFTGTFRPMGTLAHFIGQPASGTWELQIRDRYWGDTGQLTNWSLEVGDEVYQSLDVPQAILDFYTLSSTLFVDAGPNALIQGAPSTGDGGDITVNAGYVEVGNGAAISATTGGSGRGGTVRVTAADTATISGEESGLFTSTGSSGAGGNIVLQARDVQLTNGASVSGESTGTGKGGTVQITATETFRSDNSKVTTAAQQAEGGNVTIASMNVQLANGSEVSAKTSGQGDAGDIVITANDTLLVNDSSITTEAIQADGGNIKINNDYMVFLGESEITASVGGGPDTVGGNIFLDPAFVILRNSNIIANAFEGRGGNIRIIAGTFLADPNSRVDASSDKGIDGTVDIRAPIKDLSQKVSPLPEEYMKVADLLREACIARVRGGEYSSFVVGGREGLPMEPGNLMPSPLGVK